MTRAFVTKLRIVGPFTVDDPASDDRRERAWESASRARCSSPGATSCPTAPYYQEITTFADGASIKPLLADAPAIEVSELLG